jgi:hypothetical protein
MEKNPKDLDVAADKYSEEGIAPILSGAPTR